MNQQFVTPDLCQGGRLGLERDDGDDYTDDDVDDRVAVSPSSLMCHRNRQNHRYQDGLGAILAQA